MAKALNNTYFYKPWSFLLFNYSCSFQIRKVEKHRGEYKLSCTKKKKKSLRQGRQAACPFPLCFYYIQLTNITYFVIVSPVQHSPGQSGQIIFRKRPGKTQETSRWVAGCFHCTSNNYILHMHFALVCILQRKQNRTEELEENEVLNNTAVF